MLETVFVLFAKHEWVDVGIGAVVEKASFE